MSQEQIEKLHSQAQRLINNKQFKAAHQACIAILQLHPKHADAHFLLGMIAMNMGQMTKSLGLIKLALTIVPNNPEYHTFYARALSLVNRYGEAREALHIAITLGSESAIVNDTLGVVLSRLGDHTKAVTLFKKAIDKQPNNPTFLYNLAASLKFSGEFSLAEETYEKVIKLKPDYYPAHSALSELQTATETNNNLERLRNQLDSIGHNVDGQLHLCHAIAKELESLGQFSESLKVLKRGNGDKKRQLAYDISNDKILFDAIIKRFELGHETFKNKGFQSSAPIFVLGMPRSGTTLVDRIISSHSDVISAGELQNFAVELKKITETKSNHVLDIDTIEATQSIDFEALGKKYIESASPTNKQTKYFIDKMPLNFLYIGFIKKALPKAKVIILNRNAMDTCLSNFRTLFAVNFSYYNYAYDLMDTAQYYVLFKQLVTFWKDKFGDDILEVNYEKLVEQPENEVKTILNYCELEWQSSCLNFHNNPAPVSTASSVQVRQPINKHSIQRWKKYGDDLNEVYEYFQKQGTL